MALPGGTRSFDLARQLGQRDRGCTGPLQRRSPVALVAIRPRSARPGPDGDAGAIRRRRRPATPRASLHGNERGRGCPRAFPIAGVERFAVCPLVSRIAEVGERRPISRSIVSRGTSSRCGQGSDSAAIRRGGGKRRRGVGRWRQSHTLGGTPAKGAHRWKASPIGKVGGLHGSTAEAISAVPTRVLCQRGVASRLFLEKVGTSNWVARQGRPEDGPRARTEEEIPPPNSAADPLRWVSVS